jgi:hypothetical protein
MIVYHGSTEIVRQPEIIDLQRFLDFGAGFYTTTNRKQAESWARIKQRRLNTKTDPLVSVYELSDEILQNDKYKIKRFTKASTAWLVFVYSNRKGLNKHKFDIVIGPVANDTLYATLSLYEAGILNKKETIARLKTHKLFDQVSFHNSSILKKLTYIKSYSIKPS